MSSAGVAEAKVNFTGQRLDATAFTTAEYNVFGRMVRLGEREPATAAAEQP